MDEKRFWQNFCPLTAGRQLRDANLVVHCDGGRRGDACSAAAWILEAVWGDGSQIVYMAGVFVDEVDVLFSFVAEATALDQGSKFLADLHAATTQYESLHAL
ncbi:unnamed protein product [Prorocentrum cordatum]|uniref:Uncharacterized protein n=1 Tax=Prorocentrum cordatum TaxID=2364126 RepID=A0ABN9VMS5_9DINO|nr:unnamed protein product [Polarella glacialis]